MLTKKENFKNEVKNGKNGKNPAVENHQDNHHGCCQPSPSTANSPSAKNPASTPVSSDKKTSGKTRVTIRFDAGFPNQLYIRGKGANLSWDKGHLLKNVNANEWIWETDLNFTNCEFKILINDTIYENGDNHQLHAGTALMYAPHFP